MSIDLKEIIKRFKNGEIVGAKTDANTVEIQNINLIKKAKETPDNSGRKH